MLTREMKLRVNRASLASSLTSRSLNLLPPQHIPIEPRQPNRNVMSLRQLLRKPNSPIPLRNLFRNQSHRPFLLKSSIRFNSTSEAKTRTRIDRALNRLPRILHPYTNGLRNAPVTHVVSFLILHEITAVVPLFGLAGLFHWTLWIPDVLAEGSAVSEGMQKFGRYFARKGWFGFDKRDTANTPRHDVSHAEVMTAEERVEDVKKEGWNVGQSGSRILVEVATAYAITKVLLPGRVILSIWATPWFARNVLGGLRRVFGSGVKGNAAGTGATGAGIVGKGIEKGGKLP